MFSKKPITIKIKKDIYNQFKSALLDFANIDLLIGVPQEKSQREGNNEPITNAELMFIHSKGSPIRNIPPRPTIEPTIDKNNSKIAQKYSEAIKKILLFRKNEGRQDLEKLGLWLVNKVRAMFGSDELTPLRPATIKAKGSDRPLIDTGQLRKSVTYVIRRKK